MNPCRGELTALRQTSTSGLKGGRFAAGRGRRIWREGTVAAPAIDKVGPRPYHFRPGPTSGPISLSQEAIKVKSPLKFSICVIT